MIAARLSDMIAAHQHLAKKKRGPSGRARVSDRAIMRPSSRGLELDLPGGGTITLVEGGHLKWEVPTGLDDDSLELLLFPDLKSLPTSECPVPDWSLVDREMRKRSVTRALHWQDYREQHPGGFGYSWFCDYFDA